MPEIPGTLIVTVVGILVVDVVVADAVAESQFAGHPVDTVVDGVTVN
jgi:hypothetical protein